jgi:hypothetical protein
MHSRPYSAPWLAACEGLTVRTVHRDRHWLLNDDLWILWCILWRVGCRRKWPQRFWLENRISDRMSVCGPRCEMLHRMQCTGTVMFGRAFRRWSFGSLDWYLCWDFPGCDAALPGKCLPTFRRNLSLSSSRVKRSGRRHIASKRRERRPQWRSVASQYAAQRTHQLAQKV